MPEYADNHEYIIKTEGEYVMSVEPRNRLIREGDRFVVLYSPFLRGKQFINSVKVYLNGEEIPVIEKVTIEIDSSVTAGIVYHLGLVKSPASKGEVVDIAPKSKRDPTPRFIAEGWFKITGRGTVASIRYVSTDQWPMIKVGKSVYIDNELYEIRGVERVNTMHYDNAQRNIGIIVKGERKSREVIHVRPPVTWSVLESYPEKYVVKVDRMLGADFHKLENGSLLAIDGNLYTPILSPLTRYEKILIDANGSVIAGLSIEVENPNIG